MESSTSAAVVMGALVLAAIGLVTGIKRAQPKSGKATAILDQPSIPPPQTPH